MSGNNLRSLGIHNGILAFLMFACGWGIVVVHGAEVNVSPISFQEAVTDSLQVTCIPDGTGARAKEILVIEISKDRAKPIVNVRPPSHISIGKGLTNRFKAEGAIDSSNIAASYLNLTIAYPQTNDAGDYTCSLSYIDEGGLLQQDKAHAQVLATRSNSSSLDDDVHILEAKVSLLLERLAIVEKDNMRLQTQTQNHSQLIDYLLDRERYTVAFSAAVEKETTIISGRTIVFSDVILNEGQAFNETSGVFIAPRAGLYAFHLSLEIGLAGSVGEINLNVDGKDVVKLYTQDKDYSDQSSVSTVSHLHAGSEVKAVVHSAAGHPQVFGERLCVFNGYLVKL